MFVIFGADPRQNLAAVSNNTASCKLTIYYKHTSTQTHASGSYVFWYYSFLWHQESVNPDHRLANIIKQSHFLKLYWIHLSPFLSLHFRIHAKSLHVMRRQWLCWRSHTILSAWRLRVVWAAGGGICQSTSLMSTPMEWLEKRARSAKVQPHKVFNLFRHIWQSYTRLFPRCPSDLSFFWMQVNTQTKTHLLLHMYDRHQLCKYMHI